MRGRIAGSIVAACALVLLAGCSGSPDAPATPAPSSSRALDPETRAMLDEGFEKALVASGMPGAAAYISMGDEVWETSVGVGDVETEEPYDPDAVVRIGSVTKSFVGTVALQLVDEGMLSLDDTLESFIPGVTGGDRITVRDLLGMTSGIWEFTGDADLMARWSIDPLMPWTVDDTIELIKGKPAQFEPGEKVVYTDSNYILLGRIVELVGGTSLPEQIRTRIVEPLGLTATAMPDTGDTGVPDPHQQGYRPVGDAATGPDIDLVPISDINPDVAWAAGSMTATMDDLVVWAEALSDGELISPELQAEREKTDYMNESNLAYGLGLEQILEFTGHGGAIFGYNTTMMRMSDRDVTVVIVGNGSSNGSGGTLDMFLFVLQTLFPEQLEGIAVDPPAESP